MTHVRGACEIIGGVIRRLESGGWAEGMGLAAGDKVIAVNGRPVHDILDVMYQVSGEDWISVDFERAGRTDTVEGEFEGDLGIEFCDLTFDGIRRCRNRCAFCFVEQLPRNLRRTLYIKDDDYRHSALAGSFVTLSNLSEADWQRLEEQRPSPLRVSVHATDLPLRRWLLGNPKAPDILAQLERLRALNIQVHCQVVLVPGVNDGEHLVKTVNDLADLYPTVQSIAIVPVGLTRFRVNAARELRRFTAEEARCLVKRVTEWQRDFRRAYGVSLVYLGDEFYVRIGAKVPSARSYDGFQQYENGVGMVRWFLDDWRKGRKKLESHPLPRQPRITAVCGTAIASVLGEVFEELRAVGGPIVQLVPVTNRFFGPSVTVSGLLVAADVVAALQERDLGEMVMLPRTMLDSEGCVTLDDETPGDLEAKLGRPVRFADTVSEMLSIVTEGVLS